MTESATEFKHLVIGWEHGRFIASNLGLHWSRIPLSIFICRWLVLFYTGFFNNWEEHAYLFNWLIWISEELELILLLIDLQFCVHQSNFVQWDQAESHITILRPLLTVIDNILFRPMHFANKKTKCTHTSPLLAKGTNLFKQLVFGNAGELVLVSSCLLNLFWCFV